MEEKGRTAVWIWPLVFAGTVILILGAVWFVLFRVNEFHMDVELKGDSWMVLEYGEPYREPGASACMRGTLFLKDGFDPGKIRWHVEGKPDVGSLGQYTITYGADFHGYHREVSRVVDVVDTQCPVIRLKKDGELVPGEPYVEAGFTAFDNYDGDITHRVKRIETPGLVTYAVVDSSGNPAYARREIPFYDSVAPEILLTGGGEIVIPVGQFYEEPGYRAADNADGDLTEAVQVSGEVLWYQAGEYPVTYTVQDAMGNETVAERTVRVTAKPRPETVYPKKKTIYLTFDDGPGPYTMKLLDTLDRYGAKATFFVTDSGYDDVMGQIVDRGHAIGIHTVTHNYREVYAGPEAFFEDLYRMQEIIYENTGVRTTLMRFPGGSSNTVSRNSCEGLMTILTQAVQDAGFQYFDWNVDSDDAGSARKAKTVLNNVTDGIRQQGTGLVLQHDIHPYSVEAIEDILIWGRDNGYTFEALTPNSPGFHHDVNN